ncbi:MAG: gliding motility-associated C-terminal domain-containing protein [Bacteroidetes bacterium]|nr:gliding motility-associated C-terminal domain-containing protein [Bacteroidota bacterium]
MQNTYTRLFFLFIIAFVFSLGSYSQSITTDSVNPVSCFGGATGSIYITPGGTPPFTYLWDNASTDEDITGLTAGVYTLTLTDSSPGSVVQSFTVAEPALLSAVVSASTNVACNGQSTGAVDVTISGGTGSYTFAWSNSATTEDLAAIPAGTYSLLVTDANACTATIPTFTIAEPATLTAVVTASTNVACNGQSTGAVNVTVSGGTGSYTFGWSNSATTEDLGSLAAGTYSLLVMDANSCTASIPDFTISEPALALSSAVTSSVNVLCNGQSTGSVDVLIAGGTGSYTFAWSHGATTEDLTGIPAGTYSLLVTDANLCTSTISNFSITEPALPLTAVVTASTNVLCNGQSTGAINITRTGGTAGYTYAWSNGATTEDLTGIPVGTYSLLVTDANLCTTTITNISLTQPTAVSAVVTASTNVLCKGVPTGSINITASGGVGSYSFLWNNFATTEDLTGLPASTYAVLVADGNSCTAVINNITIAEPALALSASVTSSVNVACNGNSTGSVNVLTVGGTPTYTFAWSNGATTEDLTAIVANTYSLLVTDANSCTTTISTFTITQPTALNAVVTASTNVLCNGALTGAIDVTPSGGTTNYTYAWSNGATTQDLSGVAATTYSLLVTDANACTKTITGISVTQPSAITLTLTNTHVSCFGLSDGTSTVAASGGNNSSYSYSWSTGSATNTATGLLNGTVYTVSVTDGNSCLKTATTSVTQPALLVNNITTTSVTCFGTSNGTATSGSVGGNGGYTYLWNDAVTTANRTGLDTNTVYTVTLTDSKGCKAINSFSLTGPTEIIFSHSISPSTCVSPDGTASIFNVSGGMGGYTYSWSPTGQTTATATGLTAANYNATVKDLNNCPVTKTVTVTNTSGFSISIATTSVTCNGYSDGMVNVVETGGNSPYIYAWNTSATAQALTGVSAGVYSATVTDDDGCVATDVQTLVEPTQYTVTAVVADITCFGDANGTIALSVSGSNGAPYTFNWNNGTYTTQSLSGLVPNTYSVVITDGNACTATFTDTISQPSQIIFALASDSVSCNGGINGKAYLTSITGGVGSTYQYLWNNTSTNDSITGLIANTYTLQVTDSLGCMVSKTVQVLQPSPLVVASVAGSTICIGQSVTLTASATGGNGGANFTWNPGSVNSYSVAVSPTTTTTYSVAVTDSKNCTSNIQTVLIHVNAPLTVSALASDAPCGGGVVTLTATASGGDGNYTYSWTPFSTSGAVISTSVTGTTSYSVSVTDNCGTASAMYNATINVATAGASVNFAPTPNPATLVDATVTANPDNTAFTTWLWNFGDGVKSISTEVNPSYVYTDTGSYVITLLATDNNGCTSTASQTVTVNPDFALQVTADGTAFAFTPNGDGLNDVFIPMGVGIDPNNYEITIYDRWGIVVFYTQLPTRAWNGTFENNGSNVLQQDVYVWVINTKDYQGNDYTFKGTVTLLK